MLDKIVYGVDNIDMPQ